MDKFIKYFKVFITEKIFTIEIILVIILIAFIISLILCLYFKFKHTYRDKYILKGLSKSFLISSIIIIMTLKWKYSLYDKYLNAISLEECGYYIEAMEAYNEITGIYDVNQRIEEMMDEYNYCMAIQYFKNNEYSLAANYFANCVLFRDSYDLLGICLEHIKGGDV